MKEASLYQKLEDQIVKCAVCNHRCVVKSDGRGICGVRENIGGIFYALNYGKTIACHVDPIEKKPLYHFMPGTQTYSFATVGCNFHCLWCQNWEIAQAPKPDKPIYGTEISPEEHVTAAIHAGCLSISYTYSEPTIFLEYALDTMKLAHKEGLKNIWVSNGYMTTETLDLIAPYLDATNIDFKGPAHGVYEKYCGGTASYIMDNLKYLYQAGIHNEITTLVIPGVNDQKEQLEEIALFIAKELSIEVPWHITRFFPAWKMQETPVTPMETMDMAYRIGEQAGLKYIHMGNV